MGKPWKRHCQRQRAIRNQETTEVLVAPPEVVVVEVTAPSTESAPVITKTPAVVVTPVGEALPQSKAFKRAPKKTTTTKHTRVAKK